MTRLPTDRTLRVRLIPGDHDYTTSLARRFSAATLVDPAPQQMPLDATACERLCAGVDLVHIGWPEHLFALDGLGEDDYQQRYLHLLEQIAREPVALIWTLHNRLPHTRSQQTFAPIYAAWSRVCHGLIHHSRWGMELIRSELGFRPEALHRVLPHGHYADLMECPLSRQQAAEQLGLPPDEAVYGVLGRAQASKRVELIVEAFAQSSARARLYIEAITREQVDRLDPTLRDDPRITLRPRNGWLPRSELARSTRAVDALVLAHEGPTYLTSGLIADGIGAARAMLVPETPFFQEMLGPAACYHANTRESLTRLFNSLDRARLLAAGAGMQALQPAFDWGPIAQATETLYREAVRLRCTAL